jgi:hypothetical protein
MKDLQKRGGVAALLAAATNLVGAAVFMGLLKPKGLGAENPDPDRVVALLAENEPAMRAWYFVIFFLFALCMIAVTLALYERMKAASIVLAQAVAAIGLIYTGLVIVIGALSISDLDRVVRIFHGNPGLAATTWTALDSVETGLGAGGGETILSGVWFVALSWAAVRTRVLPRALSYLGLVTGLAGILAVLAWTGLTNVYAVGLLVWWVWLGVTMLRTTSVATSDQDQREAAVTRV